MSDEQTRKRFLSLLALYHCQCCGELVERILDEFKLTKSLKETHEQLHREQWLQGGKMSGLLTYDDVSGVLDWCDTLPDKDKEKLVNEANKMAHLVIAKLSEGDEREKIIEALSCRFADIIPKESPHGYELYGDMKEELADRILTITNANKAKAVEEARREEHDKVLSMVEHWLDDDAPLNKLIDEGKYPIRTRRRLE